MRSLQLSLCVALLAILTACGGAPSSAFHSAGYYVRGDTVYYLNAFPGKAFTIDDADAKTFDIIDTAYAKDKGAVYLDGAPLADADPASFALLDQPNYSEDAGHVFLRDRVVTIDVAHFAFFSGGGLSKDSEHVYGSDGQALSDDPEHFTILSSKSSYLFTADSRTVWVNGNPVKGADPATFKVLGGAYAKDADRTYYFDQPVPGADASSFKTLDEPYARDDAHAYWMGKVVTGADPDTFVVLNADFECTADAKHAFYRDLEIKGFDPSTITKGATVTNCSGTSLSFS
ncbi:MAG: DKNYY domain-containing protein [Marmoricola sp.]